MKLDPEIIRNIEDALALVQYGEVIIIVHAGKIQGIDVKNRKRLVDNCVQGDIDSK